MGREARKAQRSNNGAAPNRPHAVRFIVLVFFIFLFALFHRRQAVGERDRYVMARAFLICCVVALTGGVHALYPQNARAERTLRIQASTAERHAVRANEGQDYRVAPDGRVTFEVPPLLPIRWGRYMVTTLHGSMSYMGER
jgi:hypothetical protein